MYGNKIQKIEAMRFFAIVSVVLYHVFPNVFPNGYLGVDIFFVISGYVITLSSLKSRRTIVNFYFKRIRRLLPSLYVVLTSVLLFSIWNDSPHITKNIGQAVISTVLYLSNIFYYREIDYFNSFHSASPLLHTWSLSLEEQFYLLFPLLFLRNRKKASTYIFVIILIISLGLHVATSDILFRFYYPITRFWQISLGVILALIGTRKTNSTVHILSVASLFLLVFFNFSFNVVYLVTFLTGIVLIYDPMGDIYKSKIFWIGGGISYTLYLVHQPVIFYVRQFDVNLTFSVIISLFVSLGVSWIMWRYYEEFVRKIPDKIFLSCIVIWSLLLLGLGYNSHATRGMFKLKEKLHEYNTYTFETDFETLLTEKINLLEIVSGEAINDSSIFIIGDSKGEDLLCSLYAASKGRRCNYRYLHASEYSSELLNDENFMLSIRRAEKIVFTNTWLRESSYDVKKLIGEIRLLKPISIIVLSTSNFEDISSQYFEFQKKGLSEEGICKALAGSLRDDWQRQSNELKELISDEVFWIDKERAFIQNDSCAVLNNDSSLYIYDTGHLSVEGLKYFGNWIKNKL